MVPKPGTFHLVLGERRMKRQDQPGREDAPGPTKRMEALAKVVLQLHKQWGIAANEETGRSLMQANVDLLYRSTSFYTLSEAASFKQIGS